MEKQAFNLSQHDIHVENIVRNPAPARFYEDAIKYDPGSAITDSGALIVRSGNEPAAALQISGW